MAQLEIRRGADCLTGRLEGNVGSGAAMEHVTCNQLLHDRRRHLLIGDCLEHSEREADVDSSSPDW